MILIMISPGIFTSYMEIPPYAMNEQSKTHLDSSSDEELIKEYQTCKSAPFDVLFERYNGKIYSLFKFKGVAKDTIEDCCQDIWTAFVRTLKRIHIRQSFNAYLTSAVTKRWID